MRHNKNISFIFSRKIKILIIMCAIIFQYNLANGAGIKVTTNTASQTLKNHEDYLYVSPDTYYASSTIGACVKVEATGSNDIKIKNGIIVYGTLDGFQDKSKKLTTSATPGLLIIATSTCNLLSNIEIIGYISGSPALSIGGMTTNKGGFSGKITNSYKGIIKSSTTAIYIGVNSPSTATDIKFINKGRISGAIIVKSIVIPNTSTFSLKNEGEINASDIICQASATNVVYGNSSMENNGLIILGNATTVASTLCVGKIINNGEITANSKKLILAGTMQLENNNRFYVNKEINIDKYVTLKNLAHGTIKIHGIATFNNHIINSGYFVTTDGATITAGASFINQRAGEFYSVYQKLVVNGSFTNSGRFFSNAEVVVNNTSAVINHKLANINTGALTINNATITNYGSFVVNEISGSGVIKAQHGLVKIRNIITKGASIDIINNNSVVELESFSTIQSYYGEGSHNNELVIYLPEKLPQASSDPLIHIIKAATFTTNNKIILATDNPLLYMEKTPKKFTILQASTISVNTPDDLLYSRVYSRASNDDLNHQFRESLHSRTVLINITDATITATTITANLQYADLAIYQTDSTLKLATSLLNSRIAKATNIHPKLKKYNNTGIEASRKSDHHIDTMLHVIPNLYQDTNLSNKKQGIATGENNPFRVLGSVFFNYANEKQSKESDYTRKFYGKNIALGIEYHVPQTTFSLFTLYSTTKYTNKKNKPKNKVTTTNGSRETILDSYAAILSMVNPINDFDIASSIIYDRTKHHSGHFPDFFSNSYSLTLIPTYKYDTGDNIINLGLASQLTLVQTPRHYNHSDSKDIKKSDNTYFCISPFITVIESYKFMTSSIITTEIKAGYLYIHDIKHNKKNEQVEVQSSDNSFLLDVQHKHIKHRLYVSFAANMSANNLFYGISCRWKHDTETNTIDVKASVAYKL